MELVMRVVSQAKLYIGVLQETNITDGVYTCGSARYSIVATDGPSRHRGGVAVINWVSPRFTVEVIHQFGPNAVSFQMVAGGGRCYIIGCYLAPEDALTIDIVVAVLRDLPREA